MKQKNSQPRILGRHASVEFLDHGPQKVGGKVDTGADSSSVWASNISMDDKNRLHFTLFGPSSDYYTGKEIIKKRYKIKVVRSSSGHQQIRYTVKLSVRIDGWRVLGTFTLSDRSRNNYPVLIGTKLLKGKFLVDVSKKSADEEQPVLKVKSRRMTDLSKKDPLVFFETYYKNQVLEPEEAEV